MDQTELNQDWLDFFKALADANWLKIVGLLAYQPHTVEGLAAVLRLGASTTSHHLSKLSQGGSSCSPAVALSSDELGDCTTRGRTD